MTDPFVTDRRELSKNAPPKDHRFPRTGRRSERIRAVLERRQPDLTVVLEHVHDPHNIAAVFRSCDAVGAMCVHLIPDPATKAIKRFSRRVSGSAAKWLDIYEHASIADCYDQLRRDGFQIVATAGGPKAIEMRKLDGLRPTALVMGNEMRGLSEEAVRLADQIVTIPMVGMTRSLNISVACAVLLYEIFDQRNEAGRYESSRIGEDALELLVAEWERR